MNIKKNIYFPIILSILIGLSGCEDDKKDDTVSEQNIEPTAKITYTQNSTEENSMINFDASKSFDIDGNIVSYEWKDGDNIISTNMYFQTSYLSVGTHTIYLKVKDNDGSTNTDSTLVTITAFTITHPATFEFNNITYKTVQSPYTGKIWLDRNLGASNVCSSLNDENCYGDYYQWGRLSDGHEKENSATTEELATNIINAGNKYIHGSSYEWLEDNIDFNGSIRNNNWSKLDGTGICPISFRVPTIEEIKNETKNIGNNNNLDGFNGFLKLPSAGTRGYLSDHSISGKGSEIWLWSNTIGDTEMGELSTKDLYFKEDKVVEYNQGPNYGHSIRCIQN